MTAFLKKILNPYFIQISLVFNLIHPLFLQDITFTVTAFKKIFIFIDQSLMLLPVSYRVK